MKKLQLLMNELAEWSDKTFGEHRRNPSAIYHLKKEVDELLQAFLCPAKIPGKFEALKMEFADCFILLLDSAHHAGLSAEDLIRAAKEKLEINKLRKWGKPNKNGVIEHV